MPERPEEGRKEKKSLVTEREERVRRGSKIKVEKGKMESTEPFLY